jgi:type VI secretion system protein ImpA
MNNLKKALDDVHTQVKKFLEEKRAEEPDEATEESGDGEMVEGESGVMVKVAGVATASGAIQNRQDALKRLSDIADFFRKTEPHSPISYLVQRAVKWGNMPLENWLQDVIKDETVIFQIRQTLGFNTNLPESSE